MHICIRILKILLTKIQNIFLCHILWLHRQLNKTLKGHVSFRSFIDISISIWLRITMCHQRHLTHTNNVSWFSPYVISHWFISLLFQIIFQYQNILGKIYSDKTKATCICWRQRLTYAMLMRVKFDIRTTYIANRSKIHILFLYLWHVIKLISISVDVRVV